jgi:hypothetical protein
MLESPLWVAHQGDLNSAAEILRRTGNLDVKVAHDATVEPPRRPASIVHAARNIFSPRYRPRAVLSAVISCVQSIEYYAVIFYLGHITAPGPQGMAYAALSFPTPIRGSAVGWAQGMLRVGGIAGFLFFPMVLAACGFAAFALLAIAAMVIAAAMLVIRWHPIGVDIEAEPLPALR